MNDLVALLLLLSNVSLSLYSSTAVTHTFSPLLTCCVTYVMLQWRNRWTSGGSSYTLSCARQMPRLCHQTVYGTRDPFTGRRDRQTERGRDR